jgi:N-acyl-phosphatidylethanolamine-hydrolysing phospholipase D
MRTIARTLSFLLALCAVFLSCNTVRSTGGAVGRNITGIFRSPRELHEKITRPVRADARLAALWIGHATILLQLEDKFVLTDPNLTSTSGQFSKRLVEPGIDPVNLPPLDVVLISHLHVDHLSYGSLDLIEAKTAQLLVPEGGLVYIPNYDFPTDELRTWESWEHDGLRITAVPVRHLGWRYGLDAAWMSKSFTGYVIQYKGMTVYFGGDTGYDSLIFRETRKRFPSIDVAFLPIAPINPREYTNQRHTDPHDALQIYRDLDARTMVPMHFDTYPESLDSLGEAPAALRALMAEQHLTEQQVRIMQIGEQLVCIPR